MSSPSETTLIVLTAATSAQLLDAETVQFWQIVTALGLTITPLLALGGKVMARRVDQQDAAPPPAIDPGKPITLIIGFGRVGRLVADMMAHHGRPYVGLDSDSDLVAEGRRRGYSVAYGDAGRGEALMRMGAADAAAVVLTMDEPVTAQRIVRKLRGQFPDLPIIARARDANHAGLLYRAGATHAVPETLESSLQLSEAALVETGVAMGPVIASIHEKRDELRELIMEQGGLSEKPALRSGQLRDTERV
jgi:CPA2 family monovalent cation:H+ antiporter-2